MVPFLVIMHCSNLIKFAAAFDREIERYLRVLRTEAVPLCVCVLTSRHVEVGLMDCNRTGRLPVRVLGYTEGLGRVINNGTNINARCVRSNSLRKLGAERRTGEMLLKTSWVRSFPFPSFPCLPPSSFSFYLISTSSPDHG